MAEPEFISESYYQIYQESLSLSVSVTFNQMNDCDLYLAMIHIWLWDLNFHILLEYCATNSMRRNFLSDAKNMR